jgi:hypothetical protein
MHTPNAGCAGESSFHDSKHGCMISLRSADGRSEVQQHLAAVSPHGGRSQKKRFHTRRSRERAHREGSDESTHRVHAGMRADRSATCTCRRRAKHKSIPNSSSRAETTTSETACGGPNVGKPTFMSSKGSGLKTSISSERWRVRSVQCIGGGTFRPSAWVRLRRRRRPQEAARAGLAVSHVWRPPGLPRKPLQ